MNDNKQQGGKTNNIKHNRLTLNCLCQKCLERKQEAITASNPIVNTSSNILSSNPNVLSPNNIDHVSTNFSTPLATSTPTKPRVIENANEEPKNSTKQCNKHGQTLASTPVTAQKMMANTKIVTKRNENKDEKKHNARKRLPTKRKHVRTEPLPKKLKLHQKSILNYFGPKAPANVANAESDNEEAKTTKQLPASNNNNVQPAVKSSAIEQSHTCCIVISSDDEDENKTTTTKPSTSSNTVNHQPREYGSEWDTDGEQTILQQKREAEKNKRYCKQRNADKRAKTKADANAVKANQAPPNYAISNDNNHHANAPVSANNPRKRPASNRKTVPAKVSKSNIVVVPSANDKTATNPSPDGDPTPAPPKRNVGNRFKPKKDRDYKSITVIKCTLRSVLKQNHNSTIIVNFIEDMCKRMTKIAVMGSLAALDYINEMYNSDPQFFNTYFDGAIAKQFEAVSISRNTDSISELSNTYRALLQQSGTNRASRAYLNNSFKSLHQQYMDCFFRNIKVHGKNRVRKLFVLWHIEANGTKPTKDESKLLKSTADYIFNKKSRATPDRHLVERFLQYLPTTIPQNSFDSQTPGFMQHTLWKDSWFRMVPLYLKIQQDIDFYQQICRINNVRMHVSNFAVVPLYSNLMKHINIDNEAFKLIILHLKLWPDGIPRTKKEKEAKQNKDEKEKGAKKANDKNEPKNANDDRDDDIRKFWMTFFDETKIKRMERDGRKRFKFSIATDSVAASLHFKSDKKAEPKTLEALEAEQKKKFKLYGSRYDSNQYQRIVGLDPGYKLFLSGVVRDEPTNEELLIKISSRKYHNTTQQNIRDRKAKGWTNEFEVRCRTQREQYQERTGHILSPMASTYHDYILHRLSNLDEALALYTTKKYTRLAFDKYTRSQSTMDNIVNDMVVSPKTGKRNLIIIGGTEFASNSPIKKYRRCPGIRKLITTIKKRPNCDVITIDEYCTSQVCARCFRNFKSTAAEKTRHKKWERHGHRHRNCSDCKPDEQFLRLPNTIETRQSPRDIKIDMLQRTQRTYTKFKDLTADEAAQYEKGMQLQYGDITYRKEITKQPQASYNANRSTPLKTVWNRDVVAGRNIMIKGICAIQRRQPPATLRRPTRTPREEVDSDCD